MGRMAAYQLMRNLPPHRRVRIPTYCGLDDFLVLEVHYPYSGSRIRPPAVILVHGLEGSADSPYIVTMTACLLNAGFKVVRMNLRACGSGMAWAGRLYNAGLTIDLLAAVDWTIANLSPRTALVGYSLGANMVLKLLGESNQERNRQLLNFSGKRRRKRENHAPPETFVAVSSPLDLMATCRMIDAPRARIYRALFLKDIRARILRQGKFNHLPAVRETYRRIHSWYDFDDLFMAPTAGFSGAAEYYEHCSSRRYIPRIKTPGLILHAGDDPIVSSSGYEEIAARNGKTPYRLEVTQRGGHLGWQNKRDRRLPDRRWMDYRILSHLLAWRALALVFLAFSFFSCAPQPQWIRRLPVGAEIRPGTRAATEVLRPGLWVRPVTSRYSIIYDGVAWRGSEALAIKANGPGFTYQKMHRYVEWREEEYARIVYQEEGEIRTALPWVLFQPRRAALFRRSDKLASRPDRGKSAEIQIPDDRSLPLTPVAPPAPLLYFLGADGRTLTPLTFERFGEWYEHGIYEGCDRPFDSDSSSFLRRYTFYTEKVEQRHRYVFQREEP